VYFKTGFDGLWKAIARFVLLLPGTDALVRAFTRKEVHGFVSQAFQKSAKMSLIKIPEKGRCIHLD